MRLSLKQFLSISRLAILETIRQPVFLLAYTTGLALAALFPVLIAFTLGEGPKLVRDSTLALQFVLGLILAAYSACAALTHEIRRGTAAAVLTKPVSREVFFLAKFAGIAVVMIAFSLTLTLAGLLSVRTVTPSFDFDWWGSGPLLASLALSYAIAAVMNFFARRPFVSVATGISMAGVLLAFVVSWAHASSSPNGTPFDWRIVPAALLIAMAILVLTALSLALAIRLDVVPTVSITSFFFVGGLVSDYFFGRNANSSLMARLLYIVLPNWQHFWMADALSGSGRIPWIYVVWSALYAASYLGAMLCLGIFAFRNLEVRM